MKRTGSEDFVIPSNGDRTQPESAALREALARAERAEAELEKLKGRSSAQQQEHSGTEFHLQPEDSQNHGDVSNGGEAELRKDSMMAHLLDSLSAGNAIGHYGRLVFAMVARHFMPSQEVVEWLTRDKDFDEAAAVALVRQVEERDYNPPKRDRILEWQTEQEFPILPNPDDPDCGNLYRNLKFPDSIYQNIEQYQEHKAATQEENAQPSAND